MPSSYTFQITDAGLAAVASAQQSGVLIQLPTFKAGSAVGYTPSHTDTALHGSILYTGSTNNFSVDSNGNAMFNVVMDQSVGDFSFGELGLYLPNGTLFALTSFSAVQEKVATSASSNGNRIGFVAKLLLSTQQPVISWTNISSIYANIIEIGLPDYLSAANDATLPNAYAIQQGDENGNINLALRETSKSLWSFPATHKNVYFTSNVGAGTTTSSIAASGIPGTMPVVTGRFIMQFLSGPLKGICRYVNSSNGTALGVNTLGAVPNVGDQIAIYQSDAYYMSQVANGILDDALVYSIIFG